MGTVWRESAAAGDQRALAKLAGGLLRLGWPKPQLDELLREARLVAFARGSVIYREGSAATRLFWMLGGVAKLFVPGAFGRRTLVGLAKPGSLLGSYMLVGNRRLDTAVALTDIRSAEIDRDVFQQITSALPMDVAFRMTRGTLELYTRTFRRTVRLLTLDLRGKLALGLLDVADGFGVRDADGILLKVRLTHEDLAELAGVSRARVTNVLNEFAAAGAIVRRGRDLVVRRERLVQIADLA